MFQFPRCSFVKLCIHFTMHEVSHAGFPIRKSPDLWLCAPTRSLSQLITSFIGSWCQGIHHAPFVAWPSLFRLFISINHLTLLNFALILGLIKSIINLTKLFTKNFSWLVVFIQTIYYVQFSKNMLCASKSIIWLKHLYSSAMLSEFPFERYLVSQNWTDKS